MNVPPTIPAQALVCLVLLLDCIASASRAEVISTPLEVAYVGPRFGERTVPPPTTPAAPEPDPAEWCGASPWREWSRLTGDWGTSRPKLEGLGLTFDGSYILDASSMLGGGLRQRALARGLLDLNLTFDPKPLLGIEGGTFFIQYHSLHGPNGSADAGSLQAFSNIDGDAYDDLGEVWYEQKFLHDRLRVKLGQVDANAEFAFATAAHEFINASAGFTPALVGFATYPKPALSLNLFAYPTDWLYAGAGAYTDNHQDLSGASFERPYLLGEIGFTHKGTRRLGPGRLAVGCWQETEELDQFDGGRRDGTTGLYCVAEQQVWKEHPENRDDVQGISIFGQYGWADAQISAIEHQVGVGLTAVGLVPGRDEDTLGVYCTTALTSRVSGAGFQRDETCVECFYSLHLARFFSLKPDLQWIAHPGGHASPETAWVATLRVTTAF